MAAGTSLISLFFLSEGHSLNIGSILFSDYNAITFLSFLPSQHTHPYTSLHPSNSKHLLRTNRYWMHIFMQIYIYIFLKITWGLKNLHFTHYRAVIASRIGIFWEQWPFILHTTLCTQPCSEFPDTTELLPAHQSNICLCYISLSKVNS